MSTLGTGSLGSGTLGSPGEPGASGSPPAVFLTVELDNRLPGDPFTAPGSTQWTRIDVTNGLRELDIDRGARAAHGRIEPAEGVLIFTNHNGFLDPSFPASPYAALLNSGRQIRISHVLPDGTKEAIFTGTVKKWPVAYSQAGLDPTSEITITDIKWNLGATESPESVALYELKRGVRYPRPDHVFMFRESEGTADVNYSDDINDFEAVPKGTPKLGRNLFPFTSVSGFESGKLAEEGGYVELPINTWPEPPWTFAILTRISPNVSAWILSDSDPRKMRFWVTDSGQTFPFTLQTRLVKTDGVVVTSAGAVKPGNDEPHLIWTANTGSSVAVAMDGGGLQGATAVSPAAQMPTGVLRIGSTGQAEYAMATIWSQSLSVTQRGNLHNDIFFPWINQSLAVRIRRLLDLFYPALPMGLDPVESSILTEVLSALPAKLDRAPLLDIIERMVDGAEARFWVPRQGGLQFRWRGLAWQDAAGAVKPYPKPGKLFGVGGVPTIDYNVTDGDDDLVTACSVRNEAGALGYFEDEAASAKHGQRRLEINDVGNKFTTTLWRRAEREVYHRSRVGSYVDSFDLQIGAGVNPVDALRLDIYDRVDHARTRPYDGAVITDQLDIIGLRHRASGAGFLNWRTTVRTQPVRRPRQYMEARGTDTALTRGARTPHSAKWDLTGGFDVRVCARKLSPDKWADPAVRCLAGRRASATDDTWMIYLEGGRLKFFWVPVGGGRRIAGASVAHVKRSGPIPVWFRARLDPTVARVELFTSLDGETWTSVHTETTAAATGVATTTNELTVGYVEANAFLFDGDVMAMELKDLAGNLVGSFNPNLADQLGNVGVVSWTAVTGEVWTKRIDSQILPW